MLLLVKLLFQSICDIGNTSVCMYENRDYALFFFFPQKLWDAGSMMWADIDWRNARTLMRSDIICAPIDPIDFFNKHIFSGFEIFLSAAAQQQLHVQSWIPKREYFNILFSTLVSTTTRFVWGSISLTYSLSPDSMNVLALFPFIPKKKIILAAKDVSSLFSPRESRQPIKQAFKQSVSLKSEILLSARTLLVLCRLTIAGWGEIKSVRAKKEKNSESDHSQWPLLLFSTSTGEH